MHPLKHSLNCQPLSWDKDWQRERLCAYDIVHLELHWTLNAAVIRVHVLPIQTVLLKQNVTELEETQQNNRKMNVYTVCPMEPYTPT